MADSGASTVCVACCGVVYADQAGECHLQLPIFVDPQGALHASLATTEQPVEPLSDQHCLASICMAGVAPADVDESRREHLQRVLQRALSSDASPPDSPRRQLLQQQLQRLGSFEAGSSEEKDALRRALLSQRAASVAAAREPRGCFLTYTEQRLLLSSH